MKFNGKSVYKGIAVGPVMVLRQEEQKAHQRAFLIRSCRKISDATCAGYFFEDVCQKT
ncbi:MAG: hypothetical protein K2N95_14120 [Lachnospiraceae bacterium]|nr:hypothetical protein [Lachnospiraceae bacterium]